MNTKPGLYSRLLYYINELKGPIPYISRSHNTLRGLYGCYGELLVDSKLNQYWVLKEQSKS